MKERLLRLVDRFKEVCVLAVVDLVADKYIYGDINRVSREAPVLILEHDKTDIVPGGGGNAVNNIASLGATPLAVGIVGTDAIGEVLIDKLKRLKVDVSGVKRDSTLHTPTKTRILAGSAHSNKQQVVRIDSKANKIDRHSVDRHVENAFQALLPRADIVMVSDYNCGLISPKIGNLLAESASLIGRRAVLDSRRALGSFSGFTSATPNESEVRAALGVDLFANKAMFELESRKLMKMLKSQSLLVTCGNDGMALFEPRKKTKYIPIYGSEAIADVTGAGDTVISVYTLALGAGASFYEAAVLANYAGGIVVMKRGTATVSREELLYAVRSEELN